MELKATISSLSLAELPAERRPEVADASRMAWNSVSSIHLNVYVAAFSETAQYITSYGLDVMYRVFFSLKNLEEAPSITF